MPLSRPPPCVWPELHLPALWPVSASPVHVEKLSGISSCYTCVEANSMKWTLFEVGSTVQFQTLEVKPLLTEAVSGERRASFSSHVVSLPPGSLLPKFVCEMRRRALTLSPRGGTEISSELFCARRVKVKVVETFLLEIRIIFS